MIFRTGDQLVKTSFKNYTRFIFKHEVLLMKKQILSIFIQLIFTLITVLALQITPERLDVINEKTEELWEDLKDETEITNMLWGWWYDEKVEESRKSANVIKVWADDIRDALRTEYKVIPFIGNARLNENSSLREWEARFANKGRHLEGMSPEKVPFVILADEPDEYSVEFLEQLIDLAKEVINPDLEYTFSWRRTAIDPREEALPQNTQVIYWNHYPFRGHDYPNPYDYVETEQDFYEAFDRTLQRARRLAAPGTKFMVSSQAFSQYRPNAGSRSDRHPQSEWQFRTPPPESPIWYARYISRHDDLIGALHFVYGTNTDKYYDVAESMTEYLKHVEYVFDVIEGN